MAARPIDIAELDDDITGPDYPYGSVIAANMQTAEKRILAFAKLAPDMRVLEVKCSDPILATRIAFEVGEVIGVDDRMETLDASRVYSDSAGATNIRWEKVDFDALPFADARFDLVVSRYLLHHMPDPAHTVQEMARVLKPGGYIILVDSTPDSDKVDAFNEVERLRDPSHIAVCGVEALRGLGVAAGLVERGRSFYRIEMLHTDQHAETMPEFMTLLRSDADAGLNAYDIQTYHAPDGIRYRVPNSILAWEKPRA